MKRSDKLILIISYASLFSYGLALSIIGPIIENIQIFFTLSSEKIGLLFTALSAGFIFAVLVSGIFIEKFSILKVSLTGQSIFSIGLAVFFLSSIFPIALFGYFLIGIGGGIIQIGTNTAVSTLNKENSSVRINILHLFLGVGSLIGPVYSVYILALTNSFSNVYMFVFFLSMLIGIVYFILILSDNKVSANKTPVIRTKEANNTAYIEILKSSYVILIGLAIIFYIGVEMGINGWLSLYLEKKMNLSKLTASSFLSYFWTAITAGRIFSAYFSKKTTPEFMLLVLAISGLLSFSLFINVNTPFYSALAIILVGLSFSGMFPIFIILGGKYFKENIGKTTSILMTYLGIGFMTIPWLVGVVKEYRSLQDGMNFLFITFIFLLMVVIAIFVKSKSYKKI